MKTLYTCPVCTSNLTETDNQYICEKNHQFDKAKEGYINLLLANQKNSKDPGDTKEMISARRDFLQKGYYNELTKAVALILSETEIKTPVIMDTGCGDGYFIHNINNALKDSSLAPICYGSDISKPAVRLAAKLDKDIKFAVASSFNLPVMTNSLDFIVRMFAPGDNKEVARTLKKNGYLITVTPGPYHLDNLRKVVYKSPKLHDEKFESIPGMTQKYQRFVTYTVDIDNKTDLKNLLTMTPYYWNGDRETKNKFDTLSKLTTKVDFVISVYQNSI